jgi:hypothetical protein
MKKLALGLVSAAIAAVFPMTSMAQSVSVNVSLPIPVPAAVTVEAAAPEVAPPAPLQFEAAPDMVVVPGGNAYVYMIPNVYGVYFYDGFWFRYHNGFWFRSIAWNGVWAPVQIGIVPGVVIGLAPDYALYLPAGYYHIPFGHFHSHWRAWGHNHHWHNHGWFKNQMKHHGSHGGMHKNLHGGKKIMPGNIHKNNNGLHKSGSGGLHKSGKNGIQKTGPGGIHKSGSGLQKAGNGGLHKAAPGGQKFAKHGNGK